MPWQQLVPLLLASSAIASALTAAGTIWVKRLNRPVDDSTAMKTNAEAQAIALRSNAEADRVRAETEKMRVETADANVGIARALLGDVKAELERVRLEARSELERVRQEGTLRHDELRRDYEEKHEEVSTALAEVIRQLRMLLSRQRTHTPWDATAYTKLRDLDPDHPIPPPLGFDE